MRNGSNLNPLQFNKAYPNGAYAYSFEWDSSKIKPSVLTYPTKLVVDCEHGSRVPNCFYYEGKKGTRKRLGYYPHAVSYLSSDLQIVKDHFIADVQKSAEGRLKWLQDRVSKTESTAQGMIDKVNKL